MERLVSICVPTYNGKKYLRECLDSIISQTFSKLEILIVDDCSTDETVTIANSYANQDRRIRLVRNENNLGLVGNWNRCIELARGEWIKFVFQDDFLEPDCVEKMLAASASDSSMIVCRRNFIFDDERGSLNESYKKFVHKINIDKIFDGKIDISPENFCEAILKYLLLNFVGEPTAVMLHRKVFYRFGLFNPHLIQICDLEFWTRVGSHTGIIYVPETLANFRVHSEGESAKNKDLKRMRFYLVDPLICIHEYVFNPFYKPLRSVASEMELNVYLKELFEMKLNRFCTLLKKGVGNPLDNGLNDINEFNELIQLYPALRHCKVSTKVKLKIYKRRIKEILTGAAN